MRVDIMALGWLIAYMFLVSSQTFAACYPLLPNLRPLPASDIQQLCRDLTFDVLASGRPC